jgi:hypothetical protein
MRARRIGLQRQGFSASVDVQVQQHLPGCQLNALQDPFSFLSGSNSVSSIGV